MNIEFLTVAEIEFQETIEYYNEQREGLGEEFAEEVKRTLERIVQFPEAWAPLSKRARRCILKRFPYGIIYQIKNDSIVIIAVMHLHRDPKNWRSRI